MHLVLGCFTQYQKKSNIQPSCGRTGENRQRGSEIMRTFTWCLKVSYSSKIDIFLIQEKFNKF